MGRAWSTKTLIEQAERAVVFTCSPSIILAARGRRVNQGEVRPQHTHTHRSMLPAPVNVARFLSEFLLRFPGALPPTGRPAVSDRTIRIS